MQLSDTGEGSKSRLGDVLPPETLASSPPSNVHPRNKFDMAGENNIATTPHNSTSEGTPAHKFLNANFPPETLRKRAAVLLTRRGLVKNILRMTPEDQTKFIDRVDQVWQPFSRFRDSSPIYFYKGIPRFRLEKCQAYNCSGELM